MGDDEVLHLSKNNDYAFANEWSDDEENEKPKIC
jgi:hypothetical protein